jgi:predicted anti-sigma-YlaC factor YlaD
MNCATSLGMLSDYHDGLLGEMESLLVRQHLSECAPCGGVYYELEMIVIKAGELKDECSLTFANEALIWQRMFSPSSQPNT